MNHISIDLETLGTAPGSIVLSVGATKFDPITGEIGEKFYANIVPQSCLELGMTKDESTIAWWAEQSQEARDALKVDRKPVRNVLENFQQWIGAPEGVWGWGASFDVVLIECAYRATGLAIPWPHWNIECGKTLCKRVHIKPVRNTGVHHKADVDAEMQAIAICQAYKKLRLA